MRRWRPWLWILVLLLGGAAWSANDPERAAADPGGKALVLEVQGAIGPAAAAHVKHGLARAAEDSARVVILVIDTPGGLDASMREINRAILASSVPVASYVHPGGARATSAGTYILYASHVAAMTPGTNLGAATPVELGGAPAREPDRDKGATDEGKKDENAAPASPMNAKAVNDAVAYIRGLAGLRGRNADWAERAVREAASLTAEDALEQGVIDVIAVSL
ncbi:MAG TPA: nodulation protein NfeD, partial [Sphingomonadales bacterium]